MIKIGDWVSCEAGNGIFYAGEVLAFDSDADLFTVKCSDGVIRYFDIDAVELTQ